jgi:hypothetical protein
MKFFPLILCVLVAFSVLANDDQPAQKPLNDQYKSLTSEVEVYDGYRMVKMYVMDRFWKTVMDSMQAEQLKRQQAELEREQLKDQIAQLNATIQKQKASVENVQFEMEHITVFGRDFTKEGFTSTVFITTGVLIALLVMSIISTRVSIGAVKEAQRLYDSISHEFEDYKHHAVEKQIKLSRELQTQRNRLEALKTA